MKTNLSFNLDKLYIVTDFDHTLTTKDSQNCWGVLSSIPNVNKEYIKKSHKNNDYYLPIEQDTNLDYETKNMNMQRWYTNHFDMLIKYKIKEIEINEIGQSKSIILRDGVTEFLKFTNKNNIPVIIVSAGISNIIENVLKRNNCFFNNIYIISNIFKFKDGQIKSLRNHIIHSLNKNEITLPIKIKEVLKDKDEVIILGDNIDDSKVHLKENKKKLTIGFLNYNDYNKLKSFQQHFDIVYSQNSSFINLVNILIENKPS